MATVTLYVDGAAGADTNGGSSAGAAIISGTATATTDGTTTIALAGSPDLSGVSAGDTIYVATATGGRGSDANVFEIVSKVAATSVTVTETPSIVSNQNWAIGGAFATIQRAANTVGAGDKVWIKGGTDYGEMVAHTTVGTNIAPIIYEGYTSSPGDGGRAVIDGTSGCMTAVGLAAMYHVFKNLEFKDSSGDLVSFATADNVTFKNCKFSNAGAIALSADNYILVEQCEFLNSGGNYHVDTDEGCAIVGCTGTNTASRGFTQMTGLFFGNVNVGSAVRGIDGNTMGWVINNTIDGTSGVTDVGILFPSFIAGAIINNILYDCITGLSVTTAVVAERTCCRNNLINACTTATDGIEVYTEPDGTATLVTDPPEFRMESGGDYRLSNGSPARRAGFDAGETRFGDSFVDMGALQLNPLGAAAASGGVWIAAMYDDDD